MTNSLNVQALAEPVIELLEQLGHEVEMLDHDELVDVLSECGLLDMLATAMHQELGLDK